MPIKKTRVAFLQICGEASIHLCGKRRIAVLWHSTQQQRLFVRNDKAFAD
jgi:hypothetical protein